MNRTPVSSPALAETVIRDGNLLRTALEPAAGPKTIPELLAHNAARFGARSAFREKRDGRFTGVSWETFLLEVVRLGRSLRSSGVAQGDRVAVVSRNRSEMLVAEFAAMSIGAVYVPLFAGYSGEQTSALLAHAGARVLLVSDLSQLLKLPAAPACELILSFEKIDRREVREMLGGDCGEVLSLADLARSDPLGRPGDRQVTGFFHQAEALDPRQPCLMMYTSGTAGELKGVVLCHDNILSQQRALARLWNLSPGDRFLSYLPWHHSFGGIFEKYNALYNAAPLGLDDSAGKDFPLLLQNWKAVRPTVYFSVPAIYLELYNHVRLHPEEEDQIFHPELKFVFTAAAPLPGHISEYFASRSIPVVEGWGLTETSPCCTLTDLREPRTVPGLVGYPIPGVDVRLDGDGEILVRGPNVMLRYHENEEATRGSLDGDGWFRTGDLGAIEGKALRLITRKDRLFKLLNGERVTPSPLEVRIAGMSKYIQHVLVLGAGRQHVSALIFPNLGLIEKEFGADRAEAGREVRRSLVEAVRQLNETHPVRYERIDAFAVIGHRLTVERGELTPSMKVRVEKVLKNHQEYVEAVYEPNRDCDCTFLRKVLRLTPDERVCFHGKGLTLDRCCDCAPFRIEDE